jgi:formylglycine-generating enzyme required for sulfatase activity
MRFAKLPRTVVVSVALLTWACGGGSEDWGTYVCEGTAIPAPCEPNCAAPSGLSWVSLPAGDFWMGCVGGDFWCESDEKPAHRVSVCPFEMTATEVTQSQYAQVLGATPAGNTGCGDCPVTFVSRAEAQIFCNAVGGRLPTEAEWEYAARAGAGTVYPSGDDYDTLGSFGWFVENSTGTTHPVAGKLPNAFGLYDLLGNAFEMQGDCYHSNFRGAPHGAHEVWDYDCDPGVLLRGGGFVSVFYQLRLSARVDSDGLKAYADQGFRCVKQGKEAYWE